MSQHLRYADADPETQAAVLVEIVRSEPVLMRILMGTRSLGLLDVLLGAGAVYNTVWNVLTGRPSLSGIKDADIAYFDGSDLSYEAEDAVIRRAAAEFSDLPLPVEVRNQARVHLWYPQKFGSPYPQLTCSADMMRYYASKTHAVAVRIEEDDRLSVLAPFGLGDLFSFRITPNTALDNRVTHTAKGERARSIWPEVTVVPWPD
ncbi:nucleotidyltransferase family protein [Devosia albogilva]|uniref:Nucleotidyltransferase family protein n=1 Tax=Devosia albogilva TaxID=429726 RepID=A0ABW5QIF7_9HYPH